MEYVIVNGVIYIATLLIYWRYKRRFDLGFLIIAAFAFIALLAIPHHYFLGSLYKRTISVLPFIYLYVVLLLFIRPYIRANKNIVNNVIVPNQRKLKLIANLFIISAVVSTYVLLPLAIKNIGSGEWNEIRNELYAEENTMPYENFFEHIMMIYNQYFRLISILIFFYFITTQKQGKLFLIFLALSIVVPTFLVSINIASRGMIINLSMELLAGFILFSNGISSKIKKKIYLFAFIFIAVFLVYSMAVTDSRFGDETGYEYSANFSLLDYFGQPMLVFNDAIASMHDYANGKYFFKFIFDLFSIDSDINQHQLGGNWGVSFFTFIGALYIDFGPFGTFFLALILPYYINRNINGRAIYFENIYLYYFFYIFFLEGVFVTGYSSIIGLMFTFVIYLFLKTQKQYE